MTSAMPQKTRKQKVRPKNPRKPSRKQEGMMDYIRTAIFKHVGKEGVKVPKKR